MLEQLEQMQMMVVYFVALLAGLVSIAEVVVRFTPTKVDDGIVTRIGKRIDKVLDALKVPNRKRSGESEDAE